jgi:hypothetical protein
VWWLAGGPLAIVVLGMAVALTVYAFRRYSAEAARVKSEAAAAAAVSAAPASPELDGSAVELSTVMGRARRLADQWQQEAALLAIQATLQGGKIQTQDGASATFTFGPSPFAAAPTRAGLFSVVYDRSGLRGAPSRGSPTKALPEPMCAPEHALARVTELGEGALSVRYALDKSQRPMWLIHPQAAPEQLRLIDPQDCSVRGLVAGRGQR